MSSNAQEESSSLDSPAEGEEDEYAAFVEWVKEFFAKNSAPEGVHAVKLFNRAVRAGFFRAAKWMFHAADDGTLQHLRFNRFVLAN